MKKEIFFVTGNSDKFASAKHYLERQGINVIQHKIDIEEIQADTIEKVALDKAQKAFDILERPLFINDSGWMIPALNNFPGPFMKFINQWFKAEDFLNLMKDKENKLIILREVYIYKDNKETKLFSYDYEGEFLEEKMGEGLASDQVISLPKSDLSIAVRKEKGIRANYNNFWEEFGDWFINRKDD